MSGKVYTMKEMKNIVAYLTEHKAYGEIRGRKMWVDFANSNSTTRTWQSLKETFLKRILPDIHNPYYNLTREQIISFRQGYDVHERDKNKLEIETVAEIHKDSDQHVISSDGEAMVQGENDKCSNIISKDISEKNNCYETVDDIRRDLESPKVNEDMIQKHSNIGKILPAVEHVLKDFASDSEDCHKSIEDISAEEVQEKTDLVPPQNNDTEKKEPGSVDDVQHVETDAVEIKSEKENSMEEPPQPNNTVNDIDKQLNEKVVPTESGNERVIEKETSHDILEISSTNDKNSDTVSKKNNENSDSLITPTTSSCQPLTNSTSDTILPNNQEGLKDQTEINTKADEVVESNKSSSIHTRKRSSSAETVLLENKRHKRNSTSNISITNCNPKENACDLEIFDVHDSDSAKERATSIKIDKAKTITENPIQSCDEEPQTQNPCLNSVSLFAEQFNKTKYSDTTSDENAEKEIDPKPSGSKEPKKNQKEVIRDDVVVLKSHTESESDEEPKEKRPAVSKRVTRAQRDKALANVFGFTSGAVSSNRNRKASQNRVRRPHNVHHINNVTDSESSEWTTDTEQDNFISPPRCRQNRKTRKYLKPKSTRILSLEEEGGLFVMYGKRIYPVVKDGRIVKNYLIYESNSDSGFEQDSYWKAKYAELKKKYEENKKNKEPSERLREKRQSSATREPSSPILQSNTRKNPTTSQNRDIHAPSTSNTKPVIDNNEVVNYPVENKMSTDKIMIKYTINNAEVQLEGHWPQICPIFDKVLDVLPRKTDPQMEVARNRLEVHDQPKVISSRDSTPVTITGDYAVQEKIDKLESEIFKEIEEKDKQEQMEKTEDLQMESNKDGQMDENKQENLNNVTSRKRGRPTKPSMLQESPKSPKKQLRTNKVEQELPMPIAKPTLETVEKQSNVSKPVQSSPQVVKRRTRRSMKMALDAHNVEELKTKKMTPKQSNVTQETQEDDIRYMFPSTTPQTNSNKQKPKSFGEQIAFQKDDSSLVSESTQGYQDSDISPVKLKNRRKLKLSTITYRNKLQKKRKQRKSYPYLLQDASTDSSNTSFCQSLKSKTSQNSSEIYKSDSYQYLFPLHKKSFNRLEPINEMSPTANEVEMRPFDAVCRNQLNTDTMDSDTLINGNIEVGSSSNVSLPHSPELSVVEDISIGKEFLNSITVYHSLKNIQTNEVTRNEEQNKYLISDVDITMPLMEQMCVLHKSNTDVVMKKLPNNSNRQKKPSVSESLLNKICTVNINDNSSVSDSLDIQLRDLLLESAKKMSKATQSKEDMEIDSNIINTIQKTKARKRCSTPRKKKETIKSKLSSTKAIDDQHMEACLHVGRKSCPPAIQIQDENAGNITKINTKTIEELRVKPKGRKKKDVIKVKILRPRKKSISKENKENSSRKSSRMTICTDSGINGTESGISFPISNGSVELIHNHSETCLHANECLDNSVEFIDASTTLISIDSNSTTTELQESKEFRVTENLSPCSINNNMKGALDCNNIKCIKTYTNESKREAIYKSSTNNEVLNSSLLTEDLSDEAPVQSRIPPHLSRWYLLSEDETTNNNVVSPSVANTGGFGSNLNQIFPVTYAIPDLSTITEMSKENDSRKPFGFDSFSKDTNSQNIFL